eukprot:COSAG06_NODE_146_length_22145_cov_11.714733_24_plen_265_part_00
MGTACPRRASLGAAAGLPAMVQGWAGPPAGGRPCPAVLQASAGSSNRLLDFCSPEAVARAWAWIQLRARRPRAIVLDSGCQLPANSRASHQPPLAAQIQSGPAARCKRCGRRLLYIHTTHWAPLAAARSHSAAHEEPSLTGQPPRSRPIRDMWSIQKRLPLNISAQLFPMPSRLSANGVGGSWAAVPALLMLQLKLWVPDGALMGLSLEQDCGASRRLIWRSGAPPVSRVWGGICGIRRRGALSKSTMHYTVLIVHIRSHPPSV